ncbi:RNA polymerase sigma factor [Clostridium boliviensis]|uniref:RNA polymerase sigma factor n=1 Tax=Clostridium boliviensis TaxID=318465 RepID=A0ABU4GMY3_9CLOT|nr:RNA polymerase sigma factor [Clostridium boliviensis]MDW2798969.1 RNA polymerase sigma factor [Clostridium boliviensis]
MSIDMQEQYDKIYRYCYYKVKNSALAEDLTQETFLKYFEQTAYIERGKMLAYLYTIARNLCIDAFRKVQPELLTQDIPDKDYFEQIELNLTIRKVLNSLPEQKRELLLLRYVNELSVVEISSILQISRFAVYRRTGSAITALKKLLREEDI